MAFWIFLEVNQLKNNNWNRRTHAELRSVVFPINFSADFINNNNNLRFITNLIFIFWYGFFFVLCMSCVLEDASSMSWGIVLKFFSYIGFFLSERPSSAFKNSHNLKSSLRTSGGQLQMDMKKYASIQSIFWLNLVFLEDNERQKNIVVDSNIPDMLDRVKSCINV